MQTVAQAPVLDLGAGTALWSERLSRWFEARVIAVEPSQAMIKVARGKELSPLVLITAGRAEAIPLQNQSCELIWLSTVVNHLHSLELASEEIARVLRPSGALIVRNVFRHTRYGLPLEAFFPTVSRIRNHFRSRTETVRALAQHGFVVECEKCCTEFAATTRVDYGDKLQGRADSLVRGISNEEYRDGMERVRRWVRADPDMSVSYGIDVLVLRRKV
jgi:ubiquinone/menaquinone biosynthesis C-methylase UbiE